MAARRARAVAVREHWISKTIRYSVIIPTLNESLALSDALKNLLSRILYPSQLEIIVCDGGSEDDTLQQAGQFPVSIHNTTAGRALQMNEGARHASGDWLLFLHADTRLPANWMQLIDQCDADWGRFDVRLSGRHWLFRVIEKAMNLRSCKTAVATGDQAMFFHHDFFNQLDGFPQIPLMEDIALSKKARSLQPPACIQQPVITSSRRWEKNGIIRTMVLMWFLRLAYWAGIKPDTLHRLYYS